LTLVYSSSQALNVESLVQLFAEERSMTIIKEFMGRPVI